MPRGLQVRTWGKGWEGYEVELEDERSREGWEIGKYQLLERSRVGSRGREGEEGVAVTVGRNGGWRSVSVG